MCPASRVALSVGVKRPSSNWRSGRLTMRPSQSATGSTPASANSAQAKPPRSGGTDMTDSGRLRALTGGASVQPLVLIGIVTLTDNMTLTALGVLVPDIRDYFGVSLGVILTVQSLIAVMPILLGVPLGFLADRVRRSRLVGLGFLISGAFAVGMSLSVGVVMLALMLLGAGLGRAFEGSNQSFLADSYPLEKRALVFGVLGAMLPVASIVGPA